ncbi:hypothetical protein JCM18899A_16160 [Nocardioides sp. AN3]
MDVRHGQRVPAMLPGAACGVVRVKHDVLDAPSGEMEAGRQPRLTGTDDDGLERL